MKRIKYMFQRLFTMNYLKLFKVAGSVSKKAKRSYFSILFDIIHCGIKYGAGYLDYSLFEMYNLTEEQRKTYLTRAKNNAFVVKFNSKENVCDFDNKIKFNNIFSKFLKREYIDILNTDKSVVLKWIEDKKDFVAKTVNGSCGKGIKKIKLSDYASSEELYDFLIENKYLLIEELITQHDKLNLLHPNSVNSVRMVTVYSNGKVNYIAAFLRIGNGKFVDNINSGGMAAPINLETGIIEYPAADKNGDVYYNHPITNTSIVGFEIPYWKESLEIVQQAAHLVPTVRYVGWDIAITNNGPVFIEGNPFPGHDIYQLPIHTPNKIGILTRFEGLE